MLVAQYHTYHNFASVGWINNLNQGKTFRSDSQLLELYTCGGRWWGDLKVAASDCLQFTYANIRFPSQHQMFEKNAIGLHSVFVDLKF